MVYILHISSSFKILIHPPGQSGAPVLWSDGADGPLQAIGIHVRGPSAEHGVVCRGVNCKKFNEAVAFGPMGYDLAKLLAFINALPETKDQAKLAHKAIIAVIDALSEKSLAAESYQMTVLSHRQRRAKANHALYTGPFHGHRTLHMECNDSFHHFCGPVEVANFGAVDNFTREINPRTIWPSLCDLPLEHHLAHFPRKVENRALIGFPHDMTDLAYSGMPLLRFEAITANWNKSRTNYPF